MRSHFKKVNQIYSNNTGRTVQGGQMYLNAVQCTVECSTVYYLFIVGEEIFGKSVLMLSTSAQQPCTETV